MSQSQLNVNNSKWGQLTSSVSISSLNHFLPLSLSLWLICLLLCFLSIIQTVPSLLLRLSPSDAGADMSFTVCLKPLLEHEGKRRAFLCAAANAVVSFSVVYQWPLRSLPVIFNRAFLILVGAPSVTTCPSEHH